MKKENLPHIGFAIIMVAFVYFTAKLVTANVPLNLATWSLWVVIDTALLVSIVAAGNKRPWSIIGFEIGAVTIASIAFFKLMTGNGTWNWGSTESLAAVCAIIALVVWKITKKKSDNGGVIAITTAMYIAMIPTFQDQWHNPAGQDPWFWGACSLGCGLELIGRPKTIALAFFPACGMAANGLAAILSARQFFT